MKPPFTLTDTDKASGLWLRLKAHLSDRLEVARMRNDHALSEQQTADTRGEIRCLKSLISLEAPAIMTGDGDKP